MCWLWFIGFSGLRGVVVYYMMNFGCSRLDLSWCGYDDLGLFVVVFWFGFWWWGFWFVFGLVDGVIRLVLI